MPLENKPTSHRTSQARARSQAGMRVQPMALRAVSSDVLAALSKGTM